MQKIMLIDDHPLFSSAVADIVGNLAPEAQVSTVDTFNAAQDALANGDIPDIVFLDLSLPDSPASLSLARAVRAFTPAQVVILSAHDDEARVRQARALGVVGFISKALRPAEMTRAIAAVLQDAPVDSFRPTSTPMPPAGLSSRQAEVMELLVAGQTNKEIARRLGMAPGTVKVHVRDIFQRLGASTRTEAVALYHARLEE